jgi:hypothetical protein
MREKLQPDFLATLVAVGESIIAAQIPPSVAYSLRDELPFEAWPDDAIEATARLVMELRRRLAVATRELREKVQAVQAPHTEVPPTPAIKAPKAHKGKNGGSSVQGEKA